MKNSNKNRLIGLFVIVLLISFPVWYFTRAEVSADRVQIDAPLVVITGLEKTQEGPAAREPLFLLPAGRLR